jgi:hypothetical protein
MLIRLKVTADSADPVNRSFQAAGQLDGMTREEIDSLARDLEAGAPARFYRGGQPHGRVTTARATADSGLWLRIRLTTRDNEIWRLVETGAVNTVEIQPLPQGVDVFLKSVAATYPTALT